VLRALKNRLRAFGLPALFLAVSYYFVWNTVHGENGLQAQTALNNQLTQAAAAQKNADDTRTAWQTKVADLSSQTVAPDMLDEQARHMLNLAEPNDLVIDLPAANSGK
jgi:cell division protein FtsB